MDISAVQLQAIQRVCNNTAITEANALDSLVNRVTGLQTDLETQTKEVKRLEPLVPKKLDADVLASSVTNKKERIGMLVEGGKLTQAQSDLLTKAIEANAEVLVGTKLVDGNPVIDTVLNVIKLGAESGIDTKPKTDAQKQPHVPNGTTGELKGDVAVAEAVVQGHLKSRIHDYDPFAEAK